MTRFSNKQNKDNRIYTPGTFATDFNLFYFILTLSFQTTEIILSDFFLSPY